MMINAAPVAHAGDGYRVISRIAVTLFIIVEGVMILAGLNGPFVNEGIYITAGLRALEGHGVSDGFLTWLTGSLLWPLLAGGAYKVAGLAGARAVALLFMSLAVAASVRAARNLFGSRAAALTALLLVLNGPLLLMAHSAPYDLPAVAGIAIAFWAITELARSDHRGWLLLAALATGVACLSKYPALIYCAPLLGLLAVLRGRKGAVDILLFGTLLGAGVLAYVLPMREQLINLLAWWLENHQPLGTGLASLAVSLLEYSVLPLLLALAGWLSVKQRRAMTGILLASLLIWPLYQLLVGGNGEQTDVVIGFVLAFPLAGAGLARLASRRGLYTRALTGLIIVVLGAIGMVQMARINRSWADNRPAIEHLVSRVRPGQRLLISNSWPFTMELYADGAISSPWDVYDGYRIEQGDNPVPLCEFDWFVDEQNGYGWSPEVRAQIEACGTFKQVSSSVSTVVALQNSLRYAEFPVTTTVWQNTKYQDVE